MNPGTQSASPFSRTGVLAIVVIGFAAFLAMLYFLSAGDTGPDRSQNGRAHAAANGLNGYSALVDLVEADGYQISRSREQKGLRTSDLLVLTPPRFSDPEEIAEIIKDRQYRGPTLVIVPKWDGMIVNRLFQVKEPDEVKEGWVYLSGISMPVWADQEEGLLALGLERGGVDGLADEDEQTDELMEVIMGEQGASTLPPKPQAPEPKQGFSTRYPLPELSGDLPTGRGFFAQPNDLYEPLVVDQNNRTIVFSREGTGYSSEYEDDDGNPIERTDPSNWVVFVIEPDLVNNWGLSDQTRALAALSLVRNMNYGEFDRVVFDLTLNGFGGAMNLLTLAFQPPFLAATICLVLAMLIIGWRAFLRFGPPAVSAQGLAFGKARLVSNGADLIVRAGRLRLLAEPYITLSARRLARSLGLAKPDADAIDAALALRRPDQPSFSARANALRDATKPADILRAARALNDQTART